MTTPTGGLVGSVPGVSHRQHADIAADIGVPDIAALIDRKTVGARALAWQLEYFDPAIRQSAESGAAQHAEPHGTIAGDGKAGRHWAVPGNRIVFEHAVLQSADAVLAKLDEPYGPVRPGRDIRGSSCGFRQLETWISPLVVM